MELDPEVFSHVCWAGTETRVDRSYFWNNFRRYHINRLVIQWTQGGAGFFEDAHGRQLVPAGQAMLFTYDEPSSYGYPEEASEPYHFVALNLTPSLTLSPLFQSVRTQCGSVLRMNPAKEAATLLQEISQRHHSHSFLDPLDESDLILRLFHLMYREQEEKESYVDAIHLGYHLLQTRFTSPINLKIIASQCGVSREHFIRAFTARYHQAPGAMLRCLRLGRAREMLISSRLSVHDIASESGFQSSASLGRAYRRAYNRSPEQDRLHCERDPSTTTLS